MRFSFNPILVVGAVGFWAGALVDARADGEKPIVPEFWFAEPAPALVAAADKAGIALQALEYEATAGAPTKDDTVCILVEHVAGKVRKQWLVLLVGSELSERDRALPPPPDFRLFTSSGNEINFSGARAALAIRVIGPVRVPAANAKPSRPASAPKDVWSGALVNGGFLQLGFDRFAHAWLCMQQAYIAREGENAPETGLSARGTPYSVEEVAEGRKLMDSLGFNQEDEQALLGCVPALMEFFHVASRTPGVNDIMRSIVDIPVWSIVMRGGRMPSTGFELLPPPERLDPVVWGMSENQETYGTAFVLALNDQPSLVCRMAATAPHRPLVASAGVLGLVAARPDGKGPKLMMRVIASRLAPASSANGDDKN